MIKIAEPQVYLVGKQTIDDAELDRFLADEGVETWTTDTEVAGEKLVEVAGRTCFDPDTELLTTRGWVRAADISPDEIVATLNPSTRMFEYQQIRRRHEYDFDGLLYAAAKRDVAFSVTPDHRQYASTGWDSDRRSFSFHTTADLVQKYARFDVLTAADGWQGVCPEVIDVETATYTQAISNHTGRNYGTSTRVLKPFTVQGTRKVIALAELFAHYVANGSVAEQPGTGGGIVIYGRECDEIDRLCDLLGLSHSRYSDKRNGCPRTHVSGGRTVGKLFRESCGSTYAHKQFPRWVLDLPREILAVVWDILVRTDGHTYTSNRQLFSTGSSVLAGQVQEILAKLGFSSAIKTQVVKATGTTCYAVYKKAGRPAIVHRSDVDKVAYTGKVYCVTTDNGIVYVRKNGIVHFSGNCYMSFAKPRPGGNKAYTEHILEVGHGSVAEHAVFNLIITGVSRSFTHELVRHRSGFGYCLAGDVVVYSGSRSRGRFDGKKKRWTMRQLYAMSQDPRRKGRIRLMYIRCFDGERFVPARMRAVQASGEKPIVRVTLADGKSVRCSADHRFMTPDGWRSIREMRVGTLLATNGLPAIGLTYEYLQRQYVDNNMLLAEIAKESRCSTHTVRTWLRRYGLQKKQGQGMKGRTPPNKGKTYTLGWRHTEETRAKLREQKLGEKNPQWKGVAASAAAGRLRAQKLYPTEPCQVCGHPDGHRHHIDRDTHNNAKENIEFLCNKCHKLRHAHEDGPSHYLRVAWVPIVAIEADGYEMTYDLEVDHPAHNFVANGLVTHNSQLSQRYVDESDCAFVLPPLIRDLTKDEDHDCGIKNSWADAVGKLHAAYTELAGDLSAALAIRAWIAAGSPLQPEFDGWDCHQDVDVALSWLEKQPASLRTAIRKQSREAARSVLPNATETKIFVTGNVRALRHFIEMRGNKAADAEIQQVAGMVLDVLVKEAPNLFGDYRRGPEGIETPYRKV